MPQLLESILKQADLLTLVDIGLTALLIYWLFRLIRGTRAVSLVLGVTVLFVVYAVAEALAFRLLTQIMQTGAFVGVFALVVVFQPELRRALERIGRVGSFGWLFSPAEQRATEHVAAEVARAAASLSAEGHGALIVLERDTGLEEIAESGVMLHADLSSDLLSTIFSPRTALHDGAVIIREETIVAAGALLPLAETTIHTERFGTRHRAALGITEQTDAVVVVVSEENGQISLVERARIVRNLNEAQLARALRTLLTPQSGRSMLSRRGDEPRSGGRARRLGDLGRIVGRDGRPAANTDARSDAAQDGAGTEPVRRTTVTPPPIAGGAGEPDALEVAPVDADGAGPGGAAAQVGDGRPERVNVRRSTRQPERVPEEESATRVPR